MDHRPSFATVPTDAELRTIDRDLRYHPSPVRTPRTLTIDQVDRFDREGYLSGLRIFSADEIAGHRAWFDDLLARVLAAGGDSYSISTAHLRYAPVYDLLMEPRIVAVVKDLLGDDVVAWGSHYFCKLPGDGKVVDWHQDASYWPLTPAKTVTVWLAIDDARVDNACMRYIPGTHRLGHLTYALNEGASAAVLPQSVAGAESLGTPIDVELDAGTIAIHSDLLLHGSRANTSARRRCGLTLRYCAAEVRAGLGWAAKGTLVAGQDRTGHWGNPARPHGR